MPALGQFLARLLRAAASLLEHRSAGEAARDDPFDRAMTMLRRRYPDAPEHWLRFIAERTPAAGTVGRGPSERGEPGGTDMHRRSSGRQSRVKRLVSFTRRGDEVAESVGRRPHGMTAQEAEKDRDAGAQPRYSEHPPAESRHMGRGRQAGDNGASPPERISQTERHASPVSFVRPRFRPQPLSQQGRVTRIEPIPAAPEGLPRVVRGFSVPDKARGSDSRREANRASDELGQRSAPHVGPAVAADRPASPSASREGKEYHVASHRYLTRASASITPYNTRMNEAGKNPEANLLHAATEERPRGRENRSARVPTILTNTGRSLDVVFAPDEPKWPELPESPQVLPERERAHSAHASNASEESHRWNGLPF